MHSIGFAIGVERIIELINMDDSCEKIKVGFIVSEQQINQKTYKIADDLRSANVDFLTIGQYLQPSIKHYPLSRYYNPTEFDELKEIALSKGFLLVSSSPLTRSSYHADKDFKKLKKKRNEIANAKSIS